MTLEAMFLQLGVAGAMLLVFWRLGTMLIESWSRSDAARTETFRAGLSELNATLDKHAADDAASHREMTKQVALVHGKMDGIMTERRFTPVEGVPVDQRRTPPHPGGYRPPGKPPHRPKTED